MNTINTVGDLKAALSAYPDDLQLKVRAPGKDFTLNNDTQIYQLTSHEKSELVISLLEKILDR